MFKITFISLGIMSDAILDRQYTAHSTVCTNEYK